MSEARGGPVLSGWKLSLLAAIGGLLVGALAVSLWFNRRRGIAVCRRPTPPVRAELLG